MDQTQAYEQTGSSVTDKTDEMTATLAVVIPTWNGKELLLDCLNSLQAQTYPHFDVIVVDDGSTDDTAEVVRRDFSNVQLVSLSKNSGFCVATNAGIRAASHDYIFLLNNDMTLAPDCIERMMESAQETQADMLAPLVLWRNDPDIVYSAGDGQLICGRPQAIGFRCVKNKFRFPDRIFGISAGAGLYRRELFESVGLLDKRFIAYFEDSDLSFRARLAGFSAAFVPDAVAYHVGSASLRHREWWRTRQCFRNHMLLIIKNMPFPLVKKYYRDILAERLNQWQRLISAARARFGLFKALCILFATELSLLAQIPHALLERRRIQKSRCITIEALDALFTDRPHPKK